MPLIVITSCIKGCRLIQVNMRSAVSQKTTWQRTDRLEPLENSATKKWNEKSVKTSALQFRREDQKRKARTCCQRSNTSSLQRHFAFFPAHCFIWGVVVIVAMPWNEALTWNVALTLPDKEPQERRLRSSCCFLLDDDNEHVNRCGCRNPFDIPLFQIRGENLPWASLNP
jgi:hypothetical protein